MIGRAPAIALAVAAIAGCDPAPGNGSNPPDGGGPRASLYATDPDLANFVGTDGGAAVVLAYTDESGRFDADTANGKLVPRAKPSSVGVSFSTDDGKTWTRAGVVPPTDSSCGAFACAIELAGPPSVATAPFHDDIAVASFAFTKPGLAQPDALAIATTTDFVHWTGPNVVTPVDDAPPGRPSLSRVFRDTTLVFADRNKGELYIADSSFLPYQLGTPEVLSISPFSDQSLFKEDPVIFLMNRVEARVVYTSPRTEDGTAFDLRMLHLFRTQDYLGNLSAWQASTIFRLDDVRIETAEAGALGRAWRDAHPISFANGNSGQHIWLAYRQKSTTTGQSAIFLVDCDAGDEGNCVVEHDTGNNSAGWRIRRFDSAYTGAQLQPVVSAGPDSDTATLTWIQQVRPDSPDVVLLGVSTRDGGTTFSTPAVLAGPWTPCPTAGLVDANTHYLAARGAGLVLPWDPKQQPSPTFVNGWADSRYGCAAKGDLTFDLHVEAVQW